jgi:hypothetical protein
MLRMESAAAFAAAFKESARISPKKGAGRGRGRTCRIGLDGELAIDTQGQKRHEEREGKERTRLDAAHGVDKIAIVGGRSTRPSLPSQSVDAGNGLCQVCW